MAEKRKRRRQDEEADPPTKEEYAVAKYLRFNSQSKEGKLVGMSVQCFIASKAVDALLESKWGAGKSNTDILFGNRHSCVNFCDRLLQKGLFHRAARAEKKKGDKSKKKKKLKEGEEAEPTDEEKEKKSKRDKKLKKEKEDADKEKSDDTEKKSTEKEEKKDEEKKKKEKKLKLVMHDEQIFKDGDEVYVWIYDPVPLKTFIIGLLLVLGAIGLCLFPLWPPEVRVGVYYLSLSGAVFVGFILFLIVLRFILFCLVWLLTIGKHHFWLLPNLTEDVGFFDSFRPLYKHDKYDGSEKEAGDKPAKKGKGGGDSQKEDKNSPEDLPENDNQEKKDMDVETVSQKGSEGDKDEQNGFELVEKSEFLEDGEDQKEDQNSVDNEEEESQEDLEDQEESEPKKTK